MPIMFFEGMTKEELDLLAEKKDEDSLVMTRMPDVILTSDCEIIDVD
jgi:hypothetical protein